ncbi:MAG: ABC-F family ATP-binding cassette domain-containing protein, partial [Oscillospiraceae bacterium]|nr:ABC-F family ATP-binding cassette domain-containing protein [Oscillospiraceae bacterium]
FKPVGTLSGGEKSRLKLCMLMGNDINFLILDEPTNHLDIASREWMEDALADYSETLLFVSHDRYFIEKFATRIWSLKDGVITDFKGGYKAFRDWESRQEIYAQAQKSSAPQKKEQKKKAPNADKQIGKLEREIARYEEKMKELDTQAEEFASDYQKLMEIEEQKAQLDERLMELYEKWEELNQ